MEQMQQSRSLEGMEVVLRVSGTGAKNLAVLMAAAIQEERQTLGRTSLTSLIKSGRELTVFSIPEADLEVFKREARRCSSDEPVIDIITRAEDAPKINRIIERFHLATVKDSQSPKEQRTREDLQSESNFRQQSTTRIREETDNERPSVKEKLTAMRRQRKQEGRILHDRER